MLGALTTTGSLWRLRSCRAWCADADDLSRPKRFQHGAAGNYHRLFVYLVLCQVRCAIFSLWVGLALSSDYAGLRSVPPDMPVVMSLLNSYAGLASRRHRLCAEEQRADYAGTLDGFSGFILSILSAKHESFDDERAVWGFRQRRRYREKTR